MSVKRCILRFFAIVLFVLGVQNIAHAATQGESITCGAGEYLNNDNECVKFEPEFTITTTDRSDFRFQISAAGTYYLDCGDGEGVHEINKPSTGAETFACTNRTSTTIGLSGNATAYSASTYTAAISFSYNSKIKTVDGSLGAIFSGSSDYMFSSTFRDCTSLTSIPETLFEGVSGSATKMFDSTFADCTSLEYIPKNLFKGVSGSAENMFSSTFEGCTSLESIPENLFTNINSSAEWMFNSTFKGCTSLTSIPGNLFEGVTDSADGMFKSTFEGCTSLTSIPNNLFKGVNGSAESMFNSTFKGCKSLTYIPENLFDGVSGNAVEMFNGTFADCTSLTSIPENLFDGVTGSADAVFGGTFDNCTSLTSIPENLFKGVNGSAVAMFSGTFRDCTSLTSIPENLFEGVTDSADRMFEGTFIGCTSLTSIPGNLFKGVSGSAMAMFNYTFIGCTSLTSIPGNLFEGVTGSADYMFNGTFYGCSSLESIPENLFKGVSGSAEYMFGFTFIGCTSLTSIPEKLFAGVSGSAQSMFDSTFYGCNGLSGYIPYNTFPDSSILAVSTMVNTFNNTTLDTTCPSDTYQYITGFESAWSGKVACAPCPESHPNSDSGSISQDKCYKICDDGYGVNGTTDSSAQYDETCEPYYMTIQYSCSDCDGGNAPTAPIRCEYGTKCILPENTYEKTDYMFDKWNVTCKGCISKQRVLPPEDSISSVQMSAGEDISQFISAINTGTSFTISPTWNKAIYSVNLVYDANGGTGDAPTEPTTCTSDAQCILPENTYNKPGYVFDKWQLECDGCGENGTIDVNVGDNISQYITSLNNGKDINISPMWTECSAGSYCPGDNMQYECPNDGQSNAGASSVTECYARMDCNVGGNGKNTCYWNSWNNEYIDNCTTCELYECDEGFDLVGTKCKLSNPEFTIETIDMAPGAEFKFEVQIEGTYYVDWGDGSDTEKIEIKHQECIPRIPVSHTYANGGKYTIGMSGQAVSYNIDNTGHSACEYTQLVCMEYRRLTFTNNTNIAKLGGSLGAVFGIENQKAVIPYLFENCTNLTEIPKTLFNGFYGLRSYAATNGFQSLFKGCSSLKSIPEGLFDSLYDNNASDFKFTNTFAGCTSLKEIPKKLFANIPGGSASFDGTFDGCIGLSEIPEELFLNINIGGHNQFRNTFANCAGLKSIPENLFSTINGEVSSGMFDATFKNCTGLTSLPNSLFKNLTGKPKEWTDLVWCDSASGSFASTFAGCTNLSGYIPADMFENLDKTDFDPLSMEDIFNNTALATVCPDKMYQYETGFESAWDGKVACTQCPNGYPDSVAGKNSTINQCFTSCTTTCMRQTCPEKADCSHGNETASGNQYYDTDSCDADAPTCSMTFTCKVGYQKNDADNGCVAKTYDIKYELNDGTNNATNPDSYTIESETIVLADPTRDGYTFAGWTENGTIITQIAKGTMGDKTLVAQWKITCETGYYLPANTEVCELCLENHYCSGGPFEIQNLRQGIESCPYGLTSSAGATNIGQCRAKPKSCTIDFATQAYSKYDPNTQMYGKCIVIECESGYHIELNACVSDNQPCETENGTGIKTWNEMTKQYDACVPETCNPGYTNNGEQCVPCDNMYDTNGELAVSSYVNECEIAACMYQGEKYILENNECRLICDTQDDVTGHRRWDESSKRCVHKCEPGYITW